MALWIKNADILTMDRRRPRAQSAVVAEGAFAFVGTAAETEEFLRRHPQPELQQLDCGGQQLLPGFNDSHMHWLHYVKARMGADLRGCRSLKAVLEEMARFLREEFDPQSGLWLMGEGWNQDFFTDEKRFPNRADLDGISREIPIFIMRTCYHIGALNTPALAALGLTEQTAEWGDFLERDGQGRLTGVVKEALLDAIKSRIPTPDERELARRMAREQVRLFEKGVTSVQSDDFLYAPRPYELMEELLRLSRQGTLQLRIGEQAVLPAWEDMDRFFDQERLGGGFGDRRVKYTCIKLLADGSLGARTAYLLRPYADAPETCGLPIYRQEELTRLVCRAHGHNMAVAIHAIGDGAVQMCQNAIRQARDTMPWYRPRHGIVHCQITEQAQVRAFRELELIAYVQPVFLDYDIHIVKERVGQALADTSYAFRDYMEEGVCTAFGTDCPVEDFDPMRGIYCAVTRRDLQGRGPYRPEQAVTRRQALYAYTAAGAYASRDEDWKGRIAPGFVADFITVDHDLLTCPAREILQTRVTRTFIDGIPVWDRENQAGGASL